MTNPTLGWRHLETPTRVQYAKPPVVLTIFQIRFNAIWKIANTDGIGDFQGILLDDYPISRRVEGVQIDVNFNASGGNVSQVDAPKGWVFMDQDENWKLTIHVDSLTLEARKYNNFGELLSRINKAVAAMVQTFRPSILYRVGLRYINEIRESGSSIPIHDCVNSALLGPQVDPSFQSAVSQSSGEFVDIDETGLGLNMRYGRILAGSTVEPTEGVEIPGDPFFLIDMDTYRQFDPRKGERLDVSAVDRYANEFHGAIWQVFRWSVTEQYIGSMEVKSHD